jgi:phosphopantothenoylcysteine synthetase/decarboxylase
MNILVTAGNTYVPIDRVRGITNIFTGRTGARLALHGHSLGHSVTLLTSHPDVVRSQHDGGIFPAERWQIRAYQTLDDLSGQMAELIGKSDLDCIIHSAAVSDYCPAGVYAPDPATRFLPDSLRWETSSSADPRLVDMTAGKIKSDAPELWLRLIRTPKLIDLVRSEWCFTGALVKFKLEVGVDEVRLLEIAERSRRHSGADLMVANTLDGASEWAYVGPFAGEYRRVGRDELPATVFHALDRIRGEPKNG